MQLDLKVLVSNKKPPKWAALDLKNIKLRKSGPILPIFDGPFWIARVRGWIARGLVGSAASRFDGRLWHDVPRRFDEILRHSHDALPLYYVRLLAFGAPFEFTSLPGQ